MSERKYFEELRDPLYAKVGDVFLWPAETGKVLHLHGSVSTMRKLGFSVGRRYRAASYGQIDMLTRDPKRPRLLLVTDVRANTCVDRDTDLAINRQEGHPASSITVRELPLFAGDLEDGGYDVRAWELTGCEYFVETFVQPAMHAAGLNLGLCYMGRKDDVFVDQALEDAEEYCWKDSDYGEDCDTRVMCRMNAGTYAWQDRDSPPNASNLQNILEDACTPVDKDDRDAEDWMRKTNYMIDMPAMVVENAKALGMRAFRPTQRGTELIASRYAKYYFSMMAKRFNEMFDRVHRVYRKLMSVNASLNDRADRLRGRGFRVGRSINGQLKEASNVMER